MDKKPAAKITVVKRYHAKSLPPMQTRDRLEKGSSIKEEDELDMSNMYNESSSEDEEGTISSDIIDKCLSGAIVVHNEMSTDESDYDEDDLNMGDDSEEVSPPTNMSGDVKEEDLSSDSYDGNVAKPGSSSIITNISQDEQPFCTICGEMFVAAADLATHYSEAHIITPYSDHSDKQLPCFSLQVKCNMCHKLFPDEASMLKHEKSHQFVATSWECKICGRILANQQTLNNHMLTHTAKPKISMKIVPRSQTFYECPLCSLMFPTKLVLRSHLKNVHKKEKCYTCSICFKGFLSFKTLKVHMPKVHGKVQPKLHKCGTCSVVVDSLNNLKSHILDAHGEVAHICFLCGESFKQEATLKEHISSKHDTGGIFKCYKCGETFVVYKQFKDHMVIHKLAPEKQFECVTCHSFFPTVSAMRIHMQTAAHTMKKNMVTVSPTKAVAKTKYPCLQCTRNFKEKSKLRDHELTHIKHHKCEKCGEIVYKRSLNHVCPGAPAACFCLACGLKQDNKDSLKQHLETDHNLYVCGICVKGFEYIHNLKNHKLKVHDVKPE